MRRTRFSLLAAGLAATAVFAAGCGSDDKSSEPTKVAVKATEAGKGQYTLEAPSEIKGGVVELTLDNAGNQAPHSASLTQIGEGHTLAEAEAIFASFESPKPQEVPEWIRLYGGVGETAPGETGTATVKLDEGHYVITDDAQNGAKEPASTEFDVTESGDGDLPDTDAKVTAAETGEEDPEWEWKIDGLKAGENTFTFVSEGEKALHHIVAFPIIGDATIDDVKQQLDQDGPPSGPPVVDFEKGVSTAVIDGDKSEVTQFNLEAGRYAFVCFLPDRDKPEESHFKEGLLKEVNITK
ncbi:MAG: hypothetical protein ACR2HD_12260 [Solirubrobacteraceae bacterium]